MRYIIDRFEGEYAVCEASQGTMTKLKKESLPKEAQEGDVVLVEGDRITLDLEETENRKRRIKKLADDLWN